MSFTFDLSDHLKETIVKLAKKDKQKAIAINKKIKEVISCDENTIEHYKNLRRDLKDYKRVHIEKSFVLIFRVFKEKKHILFERFEHHDKIYK